MHAHCHHTCVTAALQFPYGVWHHGLKRNMSFYKELKESAVHLDDPEVGMLQAAARESAMTVVMGITEAAGGSLYNSQLFIGADGALLGTRRKLKPTSAERLVWGEGNGAGLLVHDTGDTGRLGGLICGEHNLALARYTMQAQQEQVHVASYPDPMMEGQPFADRVDAAVRHYAAEGQCFVLNATGFIDDSIKAALYDTPELSTLYYTLNPTGVSGMSSIIAPDGRYLAGPLIGEEGMLFAELDLSRIAFSKYWFDPSGHSGRPDIFQLRVNFSDPADLGTSGAQEAWAPPSSPPSPPPSALAPPPPSAPAPPPPSAPSSARFHVAPSAPARELGKRLTALPGGASSLADLDDAGLSAVMSEVWRHGLVCVPGQDLSAAQLVALAARIGEPIVLPNCFFVGMRDPAHPEICRVGNLLPGAESVEDAAAQPDLVIKKAKFGEYWHHDGNFLAPPRHAVLNTLHARVVPPTGGATQFLDASAALRAGEAGPFSREELARLRRTTLSVSHEWISDFANASEEDIAPLGMPHVHEAVQPHPITGEPCCYLPLNPSGLWDAEKQEYWAKSAQVWERLVAGGYYYEHVYEPGQVLLWDNLQILHRAGGGFGDHPRLLLRTQTQYAVPRP